ncbi:glycosyltransferase family 32 protein [Amanita thiersii Skay4041]|uniref:Glycosyltransferase family 32 protein n=1 Tax=Amanita thiersii Skay4041 TaxID=703135 RepID=A0A2A9NXZ9_9AGAR|nr:glycosyltransferase family 32 protein [Amanita thiersii Skay4041]
MSRRRPLYIFLSLLALILFGTLIVLSSFTYYLSIDPAAYITEDEVPFLTNTTRWNASHHPKPERIPRILHQTWKSDTLPERWRGISQACRDMMPDYEYMLWTDAASRDFIATHYPWFLDTFDHYPYNIQRADVIRYFVLHHYGGIYLDLDIGCLRPLDPLLVYPVIFPKTIPVGLSNDLMFSEKHHPIMEQTIHNLITFDHNWVLNYPTVMFSTGPMYLSMQYGLYVSTHPSTANIEVRVLPKSLYGKNAKEGEAPHSFFSHFYGSSWHADDAAFIGFLGTWGKGLMWIGLVVLLLGLLRLPSRPRKYSFRRMGGYDVLLPRWSHRTGRWQILTSATPSSSGASTTLSSPISDDDSSSVPAVPVLHLPIDLRPRSPEMSTPSDPYFGRSRSFFINAFSNFRNRVASIANGRDDHSRNPAHSRRHRHSRGVLFFLPAIFTSSRDIELQTASSNILPSSAALLRVPPCPSQSRSPPQTPEKQKIESQIGSAEDDEHRMLSIRADESDEVQRFVNLTDNSSSGRRNSTYATRTAASLIRPAQSP